MASAAALVLEVEKALDGLDALGDNTAPYRDYVASWYEAIFTPNVGQGQAPAASITVIPKDAINALDMLSGLLNRIARRAPMEQTERESLAALLDEIYAEAEVMDLPDEDKLALLSLVKASQRILGCVDFASGYQQLDAHLSQLSLRLVREAYRYPAESEVQTKLLSLAKRITLFVFVGEATGFVNELGAGVARHLTGG